MNGILVIDKPEGLTSHDVVARLRRILKTKKIGHTGTLDPFATGVLVMLVGKATRLARFLDRDVKSYEALVRFGFATDTGDRTGSRISDLGIGIEETAEKLEKADWESVLDEFRGEIEQVPPMYSAKKVKGKKLYELARQGIEIERKPVPVKIHELELLKDEIPDPKSQIRIRISCSAGTYIRTLAEDIGRRINVSCHLAELRRTKAGRFEISAAVTLEELEKRIENGELEQILIPMSEAIGHMPRVVLDLNEIERTKHGRGLRLAGEDLTDGEPVRMVGEDGELVAVGYFQKSEKLIQPRLVMI